MTSKYGTITVNEIKTKRKMLVLSDGEIDISIPSKRRRWWQVSQNILYGLGHIYNDLCAAMWFSYMMLYFQAVLQMKAGVAGAMLLLGQVVDAVATPVVGVLADKFSTKKIWHLIGCIATSCTFPLLFVRCWGCHINTTNVNFLSWWMPLYYGSLITVFQIGWAIVQISHLAIIPLISDSLEVRSELTSIRYMASVLSSLTVYFITWMVLRATSKSHSIGPSDDYKFRNVALIISFIGILTFVAYHIFFKNETKKMESDATQQFTSNGKHHNVEEGEHFQGSARNHIWQFLQMPILYQISLLYVFSRLYWALSLVYVPLFLEERLSVNPSDSSELVASVPLVVYISSLLISFLLKSKVNTCRHQVYLAGSLLSLISSLWIALAIHPHASVIQIYLVAALIGAGSSITLVSSLCLTADFIGPHSQQGATVYSIVTFADKLVTGIAVVVIENLKCDNCPQYYRGVLTYACGGSAVLGMLCLSFTMFISKHKNLK